MTDEDAEYDNWVRAAHAGDMHAQDELIGLISELEPDLRLCRCLHTLGQHDDCGKWCDAEGCGCPTFDPV